MYDVNSLKFAPSSSAQEVFEKKDATSVKNLMQYFEPSHASGSQISGDMFSSPSPPAVMVGAEMEAEKLEPARFTYPEPEESEQKQVPSYNQREDVTENLDPLRYIDLQLEILKQLSQNNDRYLNSVPFDPRYKLMRDAAEQIRRQDRDTFRTSERRVKDGLDSEARHAGMSGGRVTARHGDSNFVRQQAIADRYRQLEQYVRQFR